MGLFKYCHLLKWSDFFAGLKFREFLAVAKVRKRKSCEKKQQVETGVKEYSLYFFKISLCYDSQLLSTSILIHFTCCCLRKTISLIKNIFNIVTYNVLQRFSPIKFPKETEISFLISFYLPVFFPQTPWIWDDVGAGIDAVVIALASHQCGPGSNPRPSVISGLSLLLVLVLFLRFSSFHKNQHFGNSRATGLSVA